MVEVFLTSPALSYPRPTLVQYAESREPHPENFPSTKARNAHMRKTRDDRVRRSPMEAGLHLLTAVWVEVGCTKSLFPAQENNRRQRSACKHADSHAAKTLLVWLGWGIQTSTTMCMHTVKNRIPSYNYYIQNTKDSSGVWVY